MKLILLVTALVAVAVGLDTEIPIRVHDYSSQYPNRHAEETVFNVGVNGLKHSTSTAQMWLTLAHQHLNCHVTYHLPGNFRLTGLRIYNYNEVNQYTKRGIKNADIYVSTTGVSFSKIGSFVFPEAPGSSTVDIAHDINLPASHNARYVRIVGVTNHGDGAHTGLSEVKMYGTVGALAPQIDPAFLQGVSSEIAPPYTREAHTTLRGVGLTGDLHNAVSSDMWLSALGDLQAWIAYDLGDVYSLSTIRIWNYNEVGQWTRRSMKNARVKVSLDGVNFVDLGVYVFPESPGLASVDFRFDVELAQNCRFIRIESLSNYGDANYVGLSEVSFYGTVVPTAAPNENALMTGVGVSATSFFPNRRPEFVLRSFGLSSCFGSRFCHSVDTSFMWLSIAQDTTPTITFNLYRPRSVDFIRIFNYNEDIGSQRWETRGFKHMKVEVSTNGLSWTTHLANVYLPFAPRWSTEPFGFNVAMGGVTAQYVRLHCYANHGDANYAGLSAVQFFGEALHASISSELSNVAIQGKSSEYTGRLATNLVGTAGLLAGDRHDTDFNTMWMSNTGDSITGGSPWVAFDLGGATALQRMRVWNFNEGPHTNRGLRSFTLLVSDDGISWETVSPYPLPEGPGNTATAFPQDYDLNVLAQYVKLETNENWGGGFTGLSKVRFFGTGGPAAAHCADISAKCDALEAQCTAVHNSEPNGSTVGNDCDDVVGVCHDMVAECEVQAQNCPAI